MTEKAHESPAILISARQKALESSGYDSILARLQMTEEMMKVTKDKIKPHDWQLDVSEALHLGLDCTLLAGTGYGKTLTFALPLLLRKRLDETSNKIAVIISPLMALEDDQQAIKVRGCHEQCRWRHQRRQNCIFPTV